MYRFVDRLSPEDVEAISAFVYLEMLAAGYTSVAEFHYLHQGPDGAAYADPATLSLAVREAARQVGIRQLLLPSLYQTAGFGYQPPKHAQRRFVQSAEAFVSLYARLQRDSVGRLSTGIALHSLRAVPGEVATRVVEEARSINPKTPIHIHVAEQRQEVLDCVAATGRRPVDYLLSLGIVDERWCLVHATHLEPEELTGIAASGAVVGLCLTTEANLGDGRFALDELLASGGHFGVGTDSQVSIDPREELRLAEYNLRLWRETRVVVRAADEAHCGTLLYQRALKGGAQALGRPLPGIRPGADADLVVLDTSLASAAGVADEALIDQYLFAPRPGVVRDVWVDGEWVIQDRRHPRQDAIERNYAATLKRLTAAS
jgi:formimidoylglutamate deiminase